MLARIFDLDRGPHWADEVHRHFGRVLGEGANPSPERFSTPALDLLESPDRYHLLLDVPGVSREDIDIELDGRKLTVEAKRSTAEVGESKHLLNERRPLLSKRTIILPTSVDNESIKATIENGVLSLDIPKLNAATRRRIEIT